jgi:Asp/Glu/hydantoin racemase
MAGYTKEIEQKFGVIVIDPCAVALKFAEGFAEIGLRHSKIGHFSPPPIKTYR